MTTNARTRQRGPKTVATPQPVEETKAPEAFILPTPLLVDVLKLVGSLPASQVGMTYYQLQRLTPILSVDASAD